MCNFVSGLNTLAKPKSTIEINSETLLMTSLLPATLIFPCPSNSKFSAFKSPMGKEMEIFVRRHSFRLTMYLEEIDGRSSKEKDSITYDIFRVDVFHCENKLTKFLFCFRFR